MHDGCEGVGDDGSMVLQKVRMMGFSNMPMPVPVELECANCQGSFTMATFESACPACGMIYAVTPCHAGDPASIRPAGIGD